MVSHERLLLNEADTRCPFLVLYGIAVRPGMYSGLKPFSRSSFPYHTDLLQVYTFCPPLRSNADPPDFCTLQLPCGRRVPAQDTWPVCTKTSAKKANHRLQNGKDACILNNSCSDLYCAMSAQRSRNQNVYTVCFLLHSYKQRTGGTKT